MLEQFFEQKDTNPDVAAAQTELKALQDEMTSLPNALRVAANNADSEKIIRLTTRQQELPAYIFSAQVRLSKTRLAELEAERLDAERAHQATTAILSENIKTVFADIDAAEKVLNELYQKRNSLQLSEGSAYSVVRDFSIRIDRERSK